MKKNNIKTKIISLDDLTMRVKALKQKKNIIVQSHGVFDIIHPGVINHLNSAKEQGDILIVTVIKDKDVKKGSGMLVFSEHLRLENVASLSQVDYTCLVDDEIPFECVKRIKPNVFAWGQLYEDRDKAINKKIFEEEKELYFGKSKIYKTSEFSLSSENPIKNFLYIYPEEVKTFLKNFSKKYSFKDIANKINHLQNLKILLLGDGIIDEYHYCEPLGRSNKAPIIVNKYLNHEIFAGGAFAIANHISGLCENVQLVSLLGANNSKEDFIKDRLRPGIKTKFFHREDGPTIVKKRYINQYLNQKLFEVNYLNDNYINGGLEKSVIDYLKSEIALYDIVLVSDFGHGFITEKIIKFIEKYSKKFAVNTQTNGANAGYNMITKYHNPTYVCLDESEIRLSAQDRYGEMEAIVKKIARQINSDYFIVTRGRNGSMGINRTNEVNRTPIFSTKVVDTVGAGDAFFAYTAPCIACRLSLDLVSFIGNIAGALAVQIVGNKKPVEKYEFLEFARALLK